MATFVQLTVATGGSTWVNMEHVYEMVPTSGGGSRLRLNKGSGTTAGINVKEDPVEVIALWEQQQD